MIFRLQDSRALRVDVGRGLRDVALREIGQDSILDEPAPLVNGDISVRALGWQKEPSAPLWRIEQSAPLPFTLLSVMTEVNIND